MLKNINKSIVTLSLFGMFSAKLLGQTDIEKKYFKEEFTDTIKNESVLIVRDYEEYQITKYKTVDYKVNVVLRTQYKLKDFSALEAFNTLSKSEGLRKIIITQIKPDGTVKEIYINEDKEYKEERSEYSVNLNDGGEKLAVEGLEIGDIIDYRYEYSYTTTTYPYALKRLENGRVYGYEAIVKNYNIFKKLPEFTKFLQEKYPSLGSLYVVRLPNELKLLQKAINCNYKFIESKESNSKLFKCRIGFNASYKSEFFSYAYNDLPVLKFCVVNQDNAKKQNLYAYQFLDEIVSEDDIADLGRSFYNNSKFMPHYLYYIDTKKYAKGYEDASLNSFFGSFIKTFAKNNTDKLDVLNKFHEYITNNDELNDWQFGKMNFAILLARFCDNIKQPYKMMASLPKYNGNWSQLIHPSEINWGIYINNDGNDLFISNSESTGNIYQKEGSLIGTKVIVFNTKDKSEPEKIVFPSINYSENKMLLNCQIVFKDTSKSFDYHFKNTYTYSGSQKRNMDDHIAYKFYPKKLVPDPNIQGIVSFNLYNDELFRDSGIILPELRRINYSYENKLDRIANENFENFLSSDYHFKNIKLDSFKIIEGSGYTDDELSENLFRVEFNAENIIERTDNDMMVLKLGSLITEQMEISNFKNNVRLTNINITNQRKIEWDINIEFPFGFKPLNIDDFNQKFENEAGVFNASVLEDGTHLVLKIEKIYKTNYLPKEKWSELTNFLKQAVLFYEKKLLLEKV